MDEIENLCVRLGQLLHLETLLADINTQTEVYKHDSTQWTIQAWLLFPYVQVMQEYLSLIATQSGSVKSAKCRQSGLTQNEGGALTTRAMLFKDGYRFFFLPCQS